MTEYEPVIGLEVHAELLTQSKMFCGCPVVDSTQAPPNTTVCPVCSAQPGVLPVINHQAVEFAMMVGLALNCTINDFNQFARKSYFYPDLPKGYQISQYEHPLASNGWVDVELSRGSKRIGVRRAHLEEDTGKLFHMGQTSLVDLNRAGVPLLEIVSEPDMRSVEEVEAYARKLRAILVYLGVNHGDMSKGVLRFEANLSVRPQGSDAFNTRTEVKNLNSIRSLVRAARFEIARQTEIAISGGQVIQQTMGFDETSGETYAQRSKEQAHDYRYFPEPDLPPLHISREWVARVAKTLPELPDARRDRFVSRLGLGQQDAALLVADKAVADYFEAALAEGGDAKELANWITGELFRLMNAANLGIDAQKVMPAMLAGLIKLVEAGTINHNTAKDVLGVMFETGQDAATIVKERGLAQISDSGALEGIVDKVIAANQAEVDSYLAGKEGVFGWLVGQVMKETKGKGNAAMVNQLLHDKLAAMKK
jgi:aspartyl-tRNA(Asn)/glutamyl-tRNA(Gln) amidotransferase subunit B